MRNIQRSTAQIVLLVCSLLGAGISIYLTSVHYQNVPLVCSTRGAIDCARVLSSSYSIVPGTTIPISVPGLGWCLVSIALALAALSLGPKQRWILLAQFAWYTLGILTVLYLVYVEIVRVHAICIWCTGLHVLILIMFLVILLDLQNLQVDLDSSPGTESEEPVTTTTSRQK